VNIADVRAKFPQYSDLSDGDLAQALHKKYYTDLPFDQFAGKIGLSAADADPLKARKDESWSVQAGKAVRDIPRQLGLTARYAIEGGGALPAMIADVPGRLYNLAATGVDSLAGTKLPRAPLAVDALPAAANFLGLPEPRDANERVIGDVARTMAGAGGTVGAFGRLANSAQPAAANAMRAMAANPGQQVAAAGGAGLAGGTTREAGGGPVEQTVAALAGGLASGYALPKIANAAGNRLSPRPTVDVDSQIEIALSRRGINWADLSGDVKRQLRADVSAALNSGGELNADALARLADYRNIGATPMRGSLTLDPVQITRERNLAKTGANSTDVSLQRLARVQDANNRSLVTGINEMGADTPLSQYGAGQSLTSVLQRQLDDQDSVIAGLYRTARDSQGRSFPLDGARFTQTAGAALEDALLQSKLPADVRARLNDIALGRVPFTVDYAEQLKTRIGDLARGETDRSTRAALQIVRRALDDTPVLGLGQQTGAAGARPVNPGNLPAIPNSPALGEDAVAAFNQARRANYLKMQQIESTPALRAVYEGMEPDKFIAQFVTGQGRDASVASLTALRQALNNQPEALSVVRGQIAAHLKNKALNGAGDQVGNFGASAYEKALNAIGPEKLRLFFSAEEISQLQSIGRVARFEQFQPRGSAVNNSNSGALLSGNLLDFLDMLAGRLPIGNDMARGFVRGRQQSQALNVTPSLTAPSQSPATGLLTASPVLLNRAMPAGLLGFPSLPRGEDNRRP